MKPTNSNIKWLFLVVFSLVSFTSNAQLNQQLDSVAQHYVKKGFNGNIMYSKNDSIVFSKSYGYSNFETKARLTNSTRFELASVSKQFTAVAIAQLVEQGKLRFESTVQSILSEFSYPNITVHHLLKHQSGLQGYEPYFKKRKHWNPKQNATHHDVLNFLAEKELDLVFPTGSKYEYNNTGYIILAVIIERLTGQTYADYLKENLFQPAGMSALVYTKLPAIETLPNVAFGHTFNAKTKTYQSVYNHKKWRYVHWLNTVLGDRGIYASVRDLELWKKALRYHKLISKETYKKMITVDSVSQRYGYGLAIYETESKGKWLYHNGSWSGFKTSAMYLPESNEYLVILSNNRFEETYTKLEADLYALICQSN